MKIAADKWRHFVVGLMLGLLLQLFALKLFPFKTSVYVTLLICFAIHYGFELFSKVTGKGHYDLRDAITGVIGSIIGMASTLIIWYFF